MNIKGVVMAKITVSKIFELSKYLATKSGQELKDALIYLSEFAEVSLRSLRNGLTFRDNFDCEYKVVRLKDNTETVVSVLGGKRPTSIFISRTINNLYYTVSGFGWKFNSAGDVVVKVVFNQTPPSGTQIDVEFLLVF